MESKTAHFRNLTSRKPHNASDIKNELRQEFREKLKLSRAQEQDKTRVSLNEILREGRNVVQDRILKGHFSDEIDADLMILEEAYKELLEQEEEALEEFYKKEFDGNSVLEQCHVLCKICNNFIEQSIDNNYRYVCKDCCVTYFQDEMN